MWLSPFSFFTIIWAICDRMVEKRVIVIVRFVYSSVCSLFSVQFFTAFFYSFIFHFFFAFVHKNVLFIFYGTVLLSHLRHANYWEHRYKYTVPPNETIKMLKKRITNNECETEWIKRRTRKHNIEKRVKKHWTNEFQLRSETLWASRAFFD